VNAKENLSGLTRNPNLRVKKKFELVLTRSSKFLFALTLAFILSSAQVNVTIFEAIISWIVSKCWI